MSTPGNTCAIRVGRLLEIRLYKGYETPDDVNEMIARVRELVATLPPDTKHVTIADWRRAKVMTEAACERAVQMFVGVNPRTERSALLCGENSPTATMQAMRLIASGNNPNRRLFRSAADTIEWLGQVLTPAEAARLQQFLISED